MFKSYYVVWKQYISKNRNVNIFCLNRTMQYGNRLSEKKKNSGKIRLNRTMQYGNFLRKCIIYFLHNLFKSYYVVWKLMKLIGVVFYIGCLNRTMQYGNLDIVCIFCMRNRFKSYYVVWKLLRQMCQTQMRFCLNRTMQYGNFKIFELFNTLTQV